MRLLTHELARVKRSHGIRRDVPARGQCPRPERYREAVARPIRDAMTLAVGTELTTGSTRDTNSGELARELTTLGVTVRRTMALPDDLDIVHGAFSDALAEADLVVSTGGLGPTPDDLTREAIAAACDLVPFVDVDTESWLRTLFARRGIKMPEANLKQAWLIEGAQILPNGHGTAPGWWVERPDGRLLVALPGPPREMWPMWREHALPRLQALRPGIQRATRTLRLSGIGESALVAEIGETILRAENPQVATYARADAVDIVVRATSDGARSAPELVDEAVAQLYERVGEHVFAEGDDGWPEAITNRLAGRTLAIVESGTAGQVTALLGGAPFLLHSELVIGCADVVAAAERARDLHNADIGLAVEATERRGHMRVLIAVAGRGEPVEMERTAFQAGAEGRRRAALAACGALWQLLANGRDREVPVS